MSTLTLSATREMHGGQLSCKAENPMVPNSGIRDSRKLEIHCNSKTCTVERFPNSPVKAPSQRRTFHVWKTIHGAAQLQKQIVPAAVLNLIQRASLD